MNKLQKSTPAWHAEAKQLLAENFARINSQFLDSTKKAVWLGLFLNHVKLRGKEDSSIPHGEFGPWLKKNLPEIHWDTVCTYMRFARDVCEKGKFQIRDFPKFADGGKLPESILQIIDGKTQQQLCLEFKQMKEGDDGEFVPARGQLPGSAGYAGKPADTAGQKKLALQSASLIHKNLGKLGLMFVLLKDEEQELLLGALEKHVRVLNAWRTTPKSQRKPEDLEKIWHGKK